MMRCCDGEETPEKPDENTSEEPDDKDTLDKPDDEKIPEIERMMEKMVASLVVLQKISRMPKKE